MWSRLSSKQISVPGLPAPFDLTGVTAIRRSVVGDHIRPMVGCEEEEDTKRILGAVIHKTGKYSSTGGWTAQ